MVAWQPARISIRRRRRFWIESRVSHLFPFRFTWRRLLLLPLLYTQVLRRSIPFPKLTGTGQSSNTCATFEKSPRRRRRINILNVKKRDAQELSLSHNVTRLYYSTALYLSFPILFFVGCFLVRHSTAIALRARYFWKYIHLHRCFRCCWGKIQERSWLYFTTRLWENSFNTGRQAGRVRDDFVVETHTRVHAIHRGACCGDRGTRRLVAWFSGHA